MITKTLHRWIGALLTTGLVLAAASPAWADHESDGDSETTVIIFPGLVTSLTTTGLVVASSPVITTSSTTSSTSDAIDGCGDGPALAAYIEQNSVNMEQDIALGGGQTVTDLAAMIQLPAESHRELGKALRRDKDAFTAVLRADGLSAQERARAFAAQLKVALLDA
jgi:hypothetical protein